MQVVLASASPRRQELLRELVSDFLVAPADVDEDALTTPDPFQTAELLAKEKAKAVAASYPCSLVVGGDTVVALPVGEEFLQLTKPVDVEDAVRILLTLQGNEHLVITGISLQGPGIDHTFHDVTRVRFREVSEDEIRAYVATGEPMDKAGAYGAQGMASTFVQSLDGSFKNVVGLPVERIRMELQSLGIRLDS